MIDYYTQIIAALKTTLPTYHELFISSATITPCYSVQEYGNRDTAYGDTLGYSSLSYQVKTWASDLATLESYALSADEEMRRLGFHRTQCNELAYNDLLCKICVYEAQGWETYFDEPEETPAQP